MWKSLLRIYPQTPSLPSTPLLYCISLNMKAVCYSKGSEILVSSLSTFSYVKVQINLLENMNHIYTLNILYSHLLVPKYSLSLFAIK